MVSKFKNYNKMSIETLLPFHFAFVKATQLSQIKQHFGSLQQALTASASDWQHSQILTPKKLEKLLAHKTQPGEQQKEDALQWGQVTGQHLVSLHDEHYPSLLKELSDAPIMLYVRGAVSLLNDPQVAMVGSRHASRLGISTAEDFAQYLSSVGLTITSGLAAGIDTAAHQGGLKGQGKTLAVVGTGLDRVYPASNRNLARQIAEEGAMVSEYPLGTKPMAHHFPQRNRIISGLSTGVLVVEAALKSGSLITAKQAMEQGREVFAVPGAINNPNAKGCHELIRQGAKLVQSGQDVLEELAPLVEFMLTDHHDPRDQSISQNQPSFDAQNNALNASKSIMQYIEYEPISLDELVVLSKLPVSEIQAQVMIQELNGTLEALSAGRWRRLK
jgi:DNA processing protein